MQLGMLNKEWILHFIIYPFQYLKIFLFSLFICTVTLIDFKFRTIFVLLG
jgi:hypothetical protein